MGRRLICAGDPTLLRQPIEAKSSSQSLPLLVSLTTSPLSTFTGTSPSYQQCLAPLFTHNSRPVSHSHRSTSCHPRSQRSSPPPSDQPHRQLDRIHPGTRLPAALDAYLHLITVPMNALPINALDPPSLKSKQQAKSTAWDSDSD
jgi:ubiquitin-protein ligase E3 C